MDFKKFPVQALHTALKATPKYREVLAENGDWNEAVRVINLLDIKYTNDQLHYVKQQDWS